MVNLGCIIKNWKFIQFIYYRSSYRAQNRDCKSQVCDIHASGLFFIILLADLSQ